MPTSVSSRILNMVASTSNNLPPLQIEDFKSINKENYNIVFSTTATNKIRSHQDYHESLASLTEGKLGIVPGSLFKIEDNRSKPHLRCIASANREVIPYKGENTLKEHKFRSLQANVLEDSNGHIWRIVGQGDNRQIIQESEDDYVTLLAKRRKYAQMTASDDDFAIPFQDTDYVYFFNPKIEAMDFGFAVKMGKDNWVVSKAQMDAVKVSPVQVMEACSTDGKGLNLSQKRRELTAAARGSNSWVKEYIAYLKEKYAGNAEYLRMWEKLIRSGGMVN